MDGLIDGEKLAELRKRRNLGQRELAAIAGIDSSVISRLERNLQADCMLSIVVALASTLGVTVDELLRNGQQATNQALSRELQAVNNALSQHPETIQNQAAGILRGYLSTLASKAP